MPPRASPFWPEPKYFRVRAKGDYLALQLFTPDNVKIVHLCHFNTVCIEITVDRFF